MQTLNRLTLNGSDFHNKYSFNERKGLATRLQTNYPDRIPIIVMPGNKTAPSISRHKFLAPADIALYRFVYEVRKHITVNPEESIFIFCNGVTPPLSSNLDAVYQRYKDADGFLYIYYTRENTFG